MSLLGKRPVVLISASLICLSQLSFSPAAVGADTAAAPTANTLVLLSGVVRDGQGKPVRGAIVKLSGDKENISRFTADDGSFTLRAPAKTYEVEVTAFGYDPLVEERDLTRNATADFKLTYNWGVQALNGAEVQALLPTDQRTTLVVSECQDCHSMALPLHGRGWTAQTWRDFLPTMASRLGYHSFGWSDGKWKAITEQLEVMFGPNAKYFGPEATPPARDKVHHVEIAPEVLKATFQEFKLPDSDQIMPHSLTVDTQGEVWVAGNDLNSNSIVRFNPATRKFTTYPLSPRAIPHTPCVARDGKVWMALSGRTGAKLASVDPKTDELIEYTWSERVAGEHTCREAANGDIITASLGDRDEPLHILTPSTGEFRSIPVAKPTAYPPNSQMLKTHFPGDPPPPLSIGLYDITLDSKGVVWAPIFSHGKVVSIDPKTKLVKQFPVEGVDSIMGAVMDDKDNFYFGAYDQGKFIKLDTNTGKFTVYQPPTLMAGPYGFVFDKKRGFIWYCDLPGNNLTRFDTKTETFVEYPLPTPNYGGGRLGIGIDPQGRIWYTEWFNGSIGVLDPNDGVYHPAVKAGLDSRSVVASAHP